MRIFSSSLRYSLRLTCHKEFVGGVNSDAPNPTQMPANNALNLPRRVPVRLGYVEVLLLSLGDGCARKRGLLGDAGFLAGEEVRGRRGGAGGGIIDYYYCAGIVRSGLGLCLFGGGLAGSLEGLLDGG